MPSLPSRRPRVRPRLEIIPFIDIMFFLLATFMMVSLSMVKNEGVPVRLPQIAAGVFEDRASSATVTITEDGGLHLNKESVSLWDLKNRLVAMKTANPELKIFINGDERALFGEAVETLDEIRSLGITKVSIQTRKRK